MLKSCHSCFVCGNCESSLLMLLSYCLNRKDTEAGLNNLLKLVKTMPLLYNALHVSTGLVLLYQECARMHKNYIGVNVNTHLNGLSPATLLGAKSAGVLRTISWGSNSVSIACDYWNFHIATISNV